MGYKTWTDEALKSAVETSTTKGEVLKKLGLKSHNSGNYQTIDAAIKRLGLDISHFKEVIFGKPPSKNWDVKDILVENSPYTTTSNLKKKLLKLSLLENKCYSDNCGITEWYGRKLNLQLDHINGDRSDNRIENLRLLCPNCHSLTPTFCRGINKQSKKKCIDCGEPVAKKGNRCAKCNGLSHRGQNEKINWPSPSILRSTIDNFGFVQTGNQLGVSDNAVRKRVRLIKDFFSKDETIKNIEELSGQFPDYQFDHHERYGQISGGKNHSISIKRKDGSNVSPNEYDEFIVALDKHLIFKMAYDLGQAWKSFRKEWKNVFVPPFGITDSPNGIESVITCFNPPRLKVCSKDENVLAGLPETWENFPLDKILKY